MGVSQAKTQDNKDSTVIESFEAIPYPGATMYLHKGIAVSIAFGAYKALGGFFERNSLFDWENNLFQWQGEGSFFYAPWISGGASAKIIAGEPTENSTLVENRYHIFSRFHYHNQKFAAFAGPLFGLYNLAFSMDTTGELPEAIIPDPEDTEDDDENLKIPIHGLQSAKLDYGAGFGLGYKMLPFSGITAGSQIEHVLDTEILLKYSCGLSIDLLFFMPSIKKNVQGFFIQFEWQSAYIVDLRPKSTQRQEDYSQRRQEQVFVFGTGVAF
ncbi:MAG: hypothetical protein HQK83_06875 [Fibrobacteria bacterium]|nr:hypothetical protein [Fibrobacteria bacterium]